MYLTSEDSGHIPTYTEVQQKIKYDIQCTLLQKIQVIFLHTLKLNRRLNMIYNVPYFRRFRSYSYLYWSSTEDQIWYTMYLTSEDSGHIPTYTEAQQKIKYDIQCTLLQKIQVIFLLILKLNRRSNMIYNVPDFRRFRSYSYLYWSSTEDQIWYTMYLTSEDSGHIPTYTEAQQKIKYDIQCTWLQKIQVIFLLILKLRRSHMIYHVPDFRRFRSYSYLYWSSTEDQIWYTMYLTSEDSGHIPTYTEAQQKIKYDIQCTLLQKIQVIFLLILKLNRRSNMIYNVPDFRRFRSYSYLYWSSTEDQIWYTLYLTSEDSGHILLILKLNRRSNMIYNVPDFRRFRSYSYLYWSSTEDQIWYTMYLTSEDSGHIPTYTEAQQKIKYDIQCTWLQKIQVIFLLTLKFNRRSNMIYNVPDFRRFRSYSYLYWSSTEDQIWYTMYLTSEDSDHISTYTEAQQKIKYDIQCTLLQKIQVIFLHTLKFNRRLIDIQCTLLQKIQVIFLLILKLNISNMIYNVPDFRRFRSYSYLHWSSTED